jgi:hypothetical protein
MEKWFKETTNYKNPHYTTTVHLILQEVKNEKKPTKNMMKQPLIVTASRRVALLTNKMNGQDFSG